MLICILDFILWVVWWLMKVVLLYMCVCGVGKIINFYLIDIEVGVWLYGDYNVVKVGVVGLICSVVFEWG